MANATAFFGYRPKLFLPVKNKVNGLIIPVLRIYTHMIESADPHVFPLKYP